MCSVWNAPATLSGISRALAGGSSAKRLELLHRAGGDDLAGAVVVGRRRGPAPRSRPAPRRGRRRGRRSCRSAVVGGGLGHRLAALAHQHHRLLGGDRPGTGGGGELADAVAGDGADLAERVGRVREQLERGDQPGGDQQRLGDLGVADGLGVRLGAVVGQVDARRRSTATGSGRRTSGPRARG